MQPYLALAAAELTWFQITTLCVSGTALLISGLALTIGFFNFRLSRFPHVRVKHIRSAGSITPEKREADQTLDLRLYCMGSDMYDVRVRLELTQAEPPRFLQFRPRSKFTEPLKNGQFVSYYLSQSDLGQLYRSASQQVTEYPPQDVSIAVYTSGDVLVKRVAGSVFRKALERFAHPPQVSFRDERTGR